MTVKNTTRPAGAAAGRLVARPVPAGRFVAGLCAAGMLAAVLPAEAAPGGVRRFDGNWSVEVITERGDCDRAYRYGIVVENGAARYAGGTDFTVSGRVSGNGAVRGSISRGSERADVVGRLGAGMGRGTWTTAGARQCGGRWNAERRG